jgi:hypothetical protein
MGLMDGKPDPVSEIDRANFSHVRTWGRIDLDKGTYVIRSTCRSCGDNGEFKTQQEANAFKAQHTGTNNVCPYRKEVKY